MWNREWRCTRLRVWTKHSLDLVHAALSYCQNVSCVCWKLVLLLGIGSLFFALGQSDMSLRCKGVYCGHLSHVRKAGVGVGDGVETFHNFLA